MYCRVTAWPIGILPSAVKYMIMATSPTVHRSSIVLGSLTLRLIPLEAAKAPTAIAITAERTMTIIQTSA